MGSVSSISSPEFSDSLDSMVPCQCIDNDANCNLDQHMYDRHSIDDNADRRQIRRNGHTEICSMRSPKNAFVHPNSKYFGNNQNAHKLRDSVPDNLMSVVGNCEEKKANDVRRVASSDSIPRSSFNGLTLSPGCRVLSQECVRRSKSPDVRNTTVPLRYIQSAKVLDDVTAALLNPKILSSVFEEKPLTKISLLRSTLECVVLSSIMKLDKSSMNKLFDLMIMMVKYQLIAATGPVEVVLLTLNHTDAMRDMVTNTNAQQCVGLVHQMFYSTLTFEEIWNARNDCLKELQYYCIKVSILLRLGLQNDDGSFNLTYHKYNEKYEENKTRFSDNKLCDIDLKTYCGGSFNLFGERETILGKNMYSMSYDMSKLTSEQESHNYIKDCGIKAELGMLAVQLGTEETSYKRPFTLNLFSNEDNSNANDEEDDSNFKEDSEYTDTVVINSEKTKFNEDYKMKLDVVRADLFEDDHEAIKHNMNLLELLDKTE
ncbi:unnamed protein product [Heterotrigona itama]|uniref:Protein OSCP1 n=1 Tax=Heterotrigona itama TaxID=395501 RepID=A0A6V7H6H6_9HYME|nr:unnamed protein product [Heterotrigona itama]